ncbi:MAG: lytic murein transglycosylase [Pseudomonadota bacterium]
MPREPQAAALIAAAIGLVAGCTAMAPEAAPTAAAPEPEVQAEPAAFTAGTFATFEGWQAAFRQRALAEGIAGPTLDNAFTGLRENPTVLERDAFQPEFSRAIWQYLDSAVSDARISNGRAAMRSRGQLLSEIEARYGVNRHVVVAIWGLESAYGANYGDLSVIRSLATLAWDGRRRRFAEEQLIAALRIIEAGDIAPSAMVGSWAGAMGHTQFIPTSFLAYAVDFTGDGRRDIWDPSAADALASTANYLASFGWETGKPAVVEITLPAGFDYLLADGRTRRQAAEWEAIGIRPARGGNLPAAEGVEILLPAGSQGPAFAAYKNFRVIKRYNNATSYALAVAHLAERLEGAPPFAASWPRGDRALSRTETEELQRLLTAQGYDTKGVDGIAGPNTRGAVRAWQAANGRVPDGYISGRLLDGVRASRG